MVRGAGESIFRQKLRAELVQDEKNVFFLLNNLAQVRLFSVVEAREGLRVVMVGLGEAVWVLERVLLGERLLLGKGSVSICGI